MTEEKIYFQWQNPFLRQKIYPCRNVELMDFLVTYKEADLVQESKSKPPGEAQNWARRELSTFKQNIQSMVDRNDHTGLLEKVVTYLEQSSHNFDPWIKYMVIHFSGMRYKTAHGSYADPRQILILLESKEFSDLRRWLLGIQPDLLDAEISKAQPEISQILASKKDPQILQKLQKSQSMMKDQRLKRQGIIDFRQLQSDQRKKQYLSLLEDDALNEIEKRGPTGSNIFPDWLWAEIVRRTGLKLKYVGATNQESWDSLSYDLQRSRINSPPEWRQFFVDWLRSPGCDITAWREKNYRDLELVVSSAVCNEVSEHIHFLRGLKPSGGLTARPLFYLNAEYKDNPESQPKPQNIKSPHQIQHDKERGKNKPTAQPNLEVSLPFPGPNKPFLRRSTGQEYFQRGGSILWLRWVNPKPNPWQITHPIRDHKFLQGDGRDWRYTFQPAGTESVYLRSKTMPVSVAQPVTIRKPGDKEKMKNKKPGQKQHPTSVELTQWLRWMHESIIVDVLEMLDGWTVITFETHPMTRLDDPKQSVMGKSGQPIGATGINRYRLADLVSTRLPPRWDVFIGYSPAQPLNLPAIPGKPVPKDRTASLQQMLDPQRILVKDPPVSYFISPQIVAPLQGIDWFTEDDIQHRWDSLTPRQRQIASLLAQGHTITQIAHLLDTSSSNVQAHLRNARKQMGATSNLELVSMIDDLTHDNGTGELDSSF